MARRSTDDDEAPWLAEAAPGPRTDVSRRSVFWTLLVGLGLAAIVAIGVILLISKKDGGSAQGYMNAEQAPVITAEPGPYKIRPADPAGMTIEGLDGTMYSTGAGLDAGSAIDPSLAPEAPLPRPGTGAQPPTPGTAAQPATPGTGARPPTPGAGQPRDLVPAIEDALAAPPAPAVTTPTTLDPAVQKPAPAKPVARPVGVVPASPLAAAAVKPASIQLGAFSSEEKASAVWAGLAGKHGLSGKRITAVESGGRTLYRLRASSRDAAATCARLKAAGDACAIVE